MPRRSGTEHTHPELEERLRPLAKALKPPRAGDWLAEHHETGQTFHQYHRAKPVRRSARLSTIYLCPIGDFNADEQRVLNLTNEYLGLFFDCPVVVHRTVPLSAIPAGAKRKHPDWGDHQLLTSYILDDLLLPNRPTDALAYLALTASDLWPGAGWNFVFGEAHLRDRVGVWSIYRNGDPADGAAEFRLCLKRTIRTATHEVGHILTMHHCTAFRCLMNGSNHQEERDAAPLNPCPICLRKMFWNLRVEPGAYLQRLAAFCRAQEFAEAEWFGRAATLLGASGS
jgi:archaemetzincin